MNRILIVADAEVAASLESKLGDDDYELIRAESYDEAKGVVESVGGEIGAVILDCRIDQPMELLEWLKANDVCADVEVIVHSDRHVPERIRHGIELGAYYHLTQPFEEPQLRALVRSAIGARLLRSSLASKVEETQDCFRLLMQGVFEIRTPAEAELLAAHLGSACGDPQRGIGVLEVILNGIEHGNLGIGYEEKSRLLAAGRYEEELARRLASAEHRDKRVRVELERTGEVLEITIHDQGPGFDYRRYAVLDRDRFFDSHGRGVLLATALLDVEYLGAGNEARVRLPLSAGNGRSS